MKKNTVLTLAEKKARGEHISQLTCYDYSTARLMDEAGIDTILVGDSLGMTMQGYEDTLSVTMEEMIVYGRSVSRACKTAFVVVDMPFMSYQVSVEQAVKKEEELLAPIKARADYILNSSQMTLGMLQSRLFSLFAEAGKKRELQVTVMSFGYKHGIPLEADLVFDVRFLPNPFYVEELRPLSGLDRPVAEFVFSYPQTRQFMEMIAQMLDFLMPHYVEEGKVGLTIAIGCAGGRHRSVAIAAALNDYLVAKGISSENVNRDIEK